MPSCHPLQFDFIILKQGWPQFNTTWYHMDTCNSAYGITIFPPLFQQESHPTWKGVQLSSKWPPLARRLWTVGVLHQDRCVSPDSSPWLLMFEQQTAFQGDGQWITSEQINPYSRFFLGKKKNPTTRAPTTSIGFPEDRRVHIKNNFILSSAV